jgi:hypothetical protein
MLDDEVRIATIPTPADLQAPSMCTVQIGSEISAVLCVSGVQSTMKSARAWDFIAFLPMNSIA